MAQTVIIDALELKQVIKAAFSEWKDETDQVKQKTDNVDKLYTVNQVRKKLGKSHYTVKKLIEQGLIKTTINGLMTEAAINEFLQKN